jgi:hypothetical protein
MITTLRLQQHYLDELPLLLGGGVEVIVLVLGVRVVRIVRKHLHLYHRAQNASQHRTTMRDKCEAHAVRSQATLSECRTLLPLSSKFASLPSLGLLPRPRLYWISLVRWRRSKAISLYCDQILCP